MTPDNTRVLLIGGAVALIGAFFLFRRSPDATVVAQAAHGVPQVHLDPLDIGPIGNVPIADWTGSTGINIPPIVFPDMGGKDKCCNSCETDDISSFSQQLVNALDFGPPQPYVNTAMLTPQEAHAIEIGRAQVVYDPTSERGFFVAILPSDIPYAGASSNSNIIYQGALPVLPPDLGGDFPGG